MAQDIDRADRPSQEEIQLVADAIYEGLLLQEEAGNKSNMVAAPPAPSETTWIIGYFDLLSVAQIVLRRFSERALLAEPGTSAANAAYRNAADQS